MRGLLHDGTGGVDGVAHAIGARDSAAATVASHDAAVHLRPALARKGRAAARVELRGVLHHMHAGNNGIEGATTCVEHRHGGVEGALDVLGGLLLALGREGMTATAGTAVDDDDRLAGSAFSGIDDRSLSHLSDLSCGMGNGQNSPAGASRMGVSSVVHLDAACLCKSLKIDVLEGEIALKW